MPISLHAATVPGFIRQLRALSGILDKAAAFCADNGIAEADMLQERLAEDMFPLGYQIKSAVVHSLGGIEGIRRGTFSPDTSTPFETFAEHKAALDSATSTLTAIDPAELEGFIGKDMEFRIREFVMPFAAEDFLLAFTQPNFFFHVTTSYAILRARGVPLGKVDYLGALPKKTSPQAPA